MNNRLKGSFFEDRACDLLRSKGYKILERNYRAKHSEIDIIAKDKDYIVFIEVKYRLSERIQNPMEAVDYRKQRRIISAAREYLFQKHYPSDCPCRFDVIAFTGDIPYHLINAFNTGD